MRVLILVDCYLPCRNSVSKHIHDLGVEFHHQGHEVSILATTCDIRTNLEISIEEGVRIARVRTGRIKGTARPLRALQEARLSSLVWRKASIFLSQNPIDLLVFCSPTIFWGALVRRLKSLWSCKTYLILWDIFPQWAVDAGLLRRGFIYRFFRKKEIEQYDSADVIGVQLPGNLKYFACNFTNDRYRVEVLRNWTACYERGLPETHYRRDLGLQDKTVFVFGGNIGVAQDVDNILRLALNLSSQPKIHFLLVGEGREVSRLQGNIAVRELRNIQVVPPVDQRTYLSMLREFDVGLITLDRRLTTHNIPGKLLGYLYWGMPVLASINLGNDLFEILENYQAGFCLANGDDDNLCAAAIRLANDPVLRARMGKNSRRLLETLFSVYAAVSQITSHFQEQSAFAGEKGLSDKISLSGRPEGFEPSGQASDLFEQKSNV